MSPRHRLVHLVIQRPTASPEVVRWYIRYVWISPQRVTKDIVMAEGSLDVDGREGRALIRAALQAALDSLV